MKRWLGLVPDNGGQASRGEFRRPLVERIASWSAGHRTIALVSWVLLVIVAAGIGGALGAKNLVSFDPGQAGKAERVLNRPDVITRPAENVLVQAPAGQTVRGDPEVQRAVRQVVATLASLPAAVTDIRSPLGGGAGAASLVSADGRSALVTFEVAGPQSRTSDTVAVVQRAIAAVQSRHPRLLVAEAGDASVQRAIGHVIAQDFRKAEVTSVPITLVLLVVVFGALIAAGIPLLLAGTSVVTAISLLSIPSRWLPIGSTTSSVVLLVGMAVGVDYSLFYLRREREQRAAGQAMFAAVRTAAATSGRAIVVSGLTVMISLAGLFLTGIDVFSGLAIGTITVVGIAVIGSLTALPALLAWFGEWADRGKIPFLGKRRTAASSSRFWTGLARRVVARPLAWGAGAALVLLVLAAPALGMRLAFPGFHDLPSGLPVIRNLVAIQKAFPGGPQPAVVVVTGRDLSGPAISGAVRALEGYATPTGPIRGPITAGSFAHGQVLIVQVPLAGDGINDTSTRALATLRDRVLPRTLGRVAGISFAVAGQTAGAHDFSAQLHSRVPVVFAFVLGFAFLLLMVTFGSITIPAISIGLNLLSVGAAYGLLTLIFQDGHLSGPLGFSPYGGIVPWMPMFLFVLLFGLSMDYHVFILSRIKEARDRGATTPAAITAGIGGSAGVVTSAAVIMVAVFSIFATLSVIEFKMFGIGMSTAILLDATLVRGVLMPAALALLGDRSWYLPPQLARFTVGTAHAGQAVRLSASPA